MHADGLKKDLTVANKIEIMLLKSSWKYVLTIIIFIIGSLAAKSQKIELGIQASINCPIIPAISTQSKSKSISPSTGYQFLTIPNHCKEVFQNRVGGKINFDVIYNFENNFFLKTGIGVNLLRFKREVQIDLSNYRPIDSTTFLTGDSLYWYITPTTRPPSHSSPNVGRTGIIYIDIPIFIGYKFLDNKLSVGLGLTTSLIAFSEQYKNTYYLYQNGGIYGTEVKDNSSDGLTNLSFSLNAEFSYLIKQKYTMFLRYSRQLNPIFDKDYQYAGKAKYHLLDFGIGYKIF